MISFSQSHKCSYQVVSWRVGIIERLVSQPMSQTVDTECRLLDEENSQYASIDNAACPVTPAKSCYKPREGKPKEEHKEQVVFMLDLNDGILVQITDVRTAEAELTGQCLAELKSCSPWVETYRFGFCFMTIQPMVLLASSLQALARVHQAATHQSGNTVNPSVRCKDLCRCRYSDGELCGP